MSRSFTLTLILATLTTAHALGQGAQWQTFTSKEGGFSVSFPGTPKEDKENIPDKGGKTVEQVQHVLNTPTGAYLVSYQDAAHLAKADAETIKQSFDKVQAHLAKVMEGKIASEKPIKLGEHPGREFVLELPKAGGQFRYRLYLAKGRLYQVQAVGTKEFATSKDVDRFLDSFKITK